MELAASAWAAMTGASATAAAGSAAATGAAASTAAGAATASSGLSALQGALSISSAVAALFSGVSSYQSHRTQSAFAGVEADQARLAAEAEAIKIRRELVQRVGDTRVAFAGAGLDISSGRDIEDSLASQADFEIGNARDAGRMGRAGGLAKAASLASQGQASLVSAGVRAGERIAEYGLDLRRRR